MPLLVWTKDLVLFIFAKGIRKIFYTYDFYSYDKYWINMIIKINYKLLEINILIKFIQKYFN